MKRNVLLLIAVLILAASCSVGEQVQASIDSAFLNHYITAQEALAADDFEAAKAALDQIAGSGTDEEDLRTLASKAARAEDSEKMRTAFKPLSEQAVQHSLPQGMVVAFCPMADDNEGARWIQKDGDVANPYFGEEMLTCGTIEQEGQ